MGEEGFYVRGDGTRVYFFEEEEVRRIWSGRSGEEGEGDGLGLDGPRFEILDLAVDRRMLVNRQRRLKMYRCWIQGRFRKPVDADEQEREQTI
jgi:tRNAThr (cytosine32-N3)-methyltransferase